VVKSGNVKWTRHTANREEMRNCYKILAWIRNGNPDEYLRIILQSIPTKQADRCGLNIVVYRINCGQNKKFIYVSFEVVTALLWSYPISGIYRRVLCWKLNHFPCYLLHDGFLRGICFDPEDGCDMFLRNIGWLSTDYTAPYPRRQNLQVYTLYLTWARSN
jgi:hypothetical protein